MGQKLIAIMALFGVFDPRIVHVAQDATVALVSQGRAVCSGVWVSQTTILTAAHCVAGQGTTTWSSRDAWEQFHVHKTFHTITLLVDYYNDLALLYTATGPVHKYVQVADAPPKDDDPVYTVGHPRGFLWSTTYGRVEVATRRGFPDNPDSPRRWTQVHIDIVPGNSGGGLFDRRGRLVGVAQFYVPGSQISGFAHWRSVLRMLQHD